MADFACNPDESAGMAAHWDIERQCRFVFNHLGGRIGLTNDLKLVEAAQLEGLRCKKYDRVPGFPEWEIELGGQVMLQDPDKLA